MSTSTNTSTTAHSGNSFSSNSTVTSYIASLRPKETEDPLSLCYLLTRRVSQSTNIRLGNELEKIFNLYVGDSCDDVRNIDRRIERGIRQKDFLMQCRDTIVYGEFKANINLDTEKSKATRDKINSVAVELTNAHPALTVRPYLVCLRYLTNSEIPPSIRAKYHDVNLIGIRDFFTDVLHHSMIELENYDNYVPFLMSIVDRLEPADQ